MGLLNWPSQNFLLNAMPQDVVERLCLDLERVQMTAGQVLCEPGVAVRDVFFPATSIVSMSYVMESGSSAEIALIGREGMVGVTLLLGTACSTVQASVQSAGVGFRLPGRCLIEEFERGGAHQRAVATLARDRGQVGEFLLRQLQMALSPRVQQPVLHAHERAGHLAVGVEQAVSREIAHESMQALVHLRQQKVINEGRWWRSQSKVSNGICATRLWRNAMRSDWRGAFRISVPSPNQLPTD